MRHFLPAKRGPVFWKCWRSKFVPQSKRVSQVDGLINDGEIAQKFELFFNRYAHTCLMMVIKTYKQWKYEERLLWHAIYR